MRMIQLADEFFETKNDPSQLDISEEVMEQLRSIHPATMGEISNDEGPIAWTIVIPTERSTRERFMNGEIGEKELLSTTLDEHDRHLEGDGHVKFTAVYLCSALVLPEFRGKGLAKKLVLDSIRAIQNDHPIDELYVWAFSGEGNALAEKIALELQLPLFRR
ncbi:MAG: GNAT family N-acetyltransferase [Bacteroidota bacterium]